MSEDPVELIETVVAHDELAAAAPARLDCHACTELIRQLLLESRDIRVAVARAITGRPSILLADEPTGNLDSKSGEALMEMFGELHAGGATVCLATHDPRWLARVRRHIYLFDGRMVDSPTDQD